MKDLAAKETLFNIKNSSTNFVGDEVLSALIIFCGCSELTMPSTPQSSALICLSYIQPVHVACMNRPSEPPSPRPLRYPAQQSGEQANSSTVRACAVVAT